tara:strand:+ start:327 stop:497 length:171 start_codon:yes stop_codon:yes gene_type:complete
VLPAQQIKVTTVAIHSHLTEATRTVGTGAVAAVVLVVTPVTVTVVALTMKLMVVKV